MRDLKITIECKDDQISYFAGGKGYGDLTTEEYESLIAMAQTTLKDITESLKDRLERTKQGEKISFTFLPDEVKTISYPVPVPYYIPYIEHTMYSLRFGWGW
jgi:hypothetical protein